MFWIAQIVQTNRWKSEMTCKIHLSQGNYKGAENEGGKTPDTRIHANWKWNMLIWHSKRSHLETLFLGKRMFTWIFILIVQESSRNMSYIGNTPTFCLMIFHSKKTFFFKENNCLPIILKVAHSKGHLFTKSWFAYAPANQINFWCRDEWWFWLLGKKVGTYLK